jgi:3',5'-cyclic AMP phosphodiesterase CpdA
MAERRLFFIMPFGSRGVIPGAEPFDFDAFYQDVLRPIAVDSSWDPLRVDEVVAPGAITNQAIQELLRSELVVADVSSANSNVYYELGVRQAISASGVILIAQAGTRLPFDIAHQRVLFYSPTEEGVLEFSNNFGRALRNWSPTADTASPVQAALVELGVASTPTVDPVGFERELDLKISRAANLDQLIGVWAWAESLSPLPVSQLVSLAMKFADAGEYGKALEVLSAQPEHVEADYEVHRLKGFFLGRLDLHGDAIREFEEALRLNAHDPETLGMLAGTYKRQGDFANALSLYERGLELSPTSSYMQVNRAVLHILANPSDPSAGVELYRQLLSSLPEPSEQSSWDALVEAEARLVVGDDDLVLQGVERALSLGARRSDLRSLRDQLRLLKTAGFRSASVAGVEVWIDRHLERPEPDTGDTASASARSRLIVHISDPHFGTSVRGGETVDMHRFFEGENTRNLVEELIAELQRADLARFSPEDVFIVVSGDLTYQASIVEFDLVAKFLDGLCTGLGLERSHVIMVPGNHDVDWALSGIDRDRRFDNYLSFVRDFYQSDFDSRHPLLDWDFDISSPRPSANQLISFFESGNLIFVGLNSCIYEDDQRHFGFIGRRQLDAVGELMKDVDRDCIRVAVMHHHLHPFPELLESRDAEEVWTDSSTIRDAGYVEQRLEKLGFDLVLHGHKHKPQLRETLVRHAFSDDEAADRSLIISGAGSVGVNSRELEHSQSNHYALLELLRSKREVGAEFLRVEWREMSYVPGAEWATGSRWIIKG